MWTPSHLLEEQQIVTAQKLLKKRQNFWVLLCPWTSFLKLQEVFPCPPISCTQQSDFNNYSFSSSFLIYKPTWGLLNSLCVNQYVSGDEKCSILLSFLLCTEQFCFLTEMPFSFWKLSEICSFKNLLHGMYLQFVNTVCQRMIWFSGEAARYLRVMRSKGNKLTLSLPQSRQILMGPSNSSGKVFCFFWTSWMLVSVKTCNYFFLYFAVQVTKRSSLKPNVSIEALFRYSFIW